jgi:hypothetical protein
MKKRAPGQKKQGDEFAPACEPHRSKQDGHADDEIHQIGGDE